MAIERLVKKEGLPYDLVVARTVAEAVAQLQQGGLDLAIIDYTLPDGSGLEVQKQAGETPCIFVTGAANQAIAVQAMKAGAYDFLVKDTQREYLQLLPTVVQATLARQQAEQVLRESEERYRNLYSMIRLMADNMPDLLWAKDMQRRFVFVNKAICEKLLNACDTDEPIRKTDMFFANRERQAHPDQPDWHSFGELCRDSDGVVMANRQPKRFDEFGNIKGEFMFLDVYKAPFWDQQGEMIGTVGCGRIVTREKEIEKERLQATETIRRRVQEQRALNALLQIPMEDISLAEGLEHILDVILALSWLPLLPRGGIFLVGDDPESLELSMQRNFNLSIQTICAQVPFGRCHCGQAAVNRNVVYADCVDERHENRYEGMSPHGHYCVPILARGRVLGVLVLYLNEGHLYNDHEVTFLEVAASTIAEIIERKRAEAEIKQHNEELAALNAIAAAMSKSLDIDSILTAALQQVVAFTGVDGIECHLPDDNGDLALVKSWEMDKEFAVASRDFRFPVGGGIPGLAFACHTPVYVPDAPTDERCWRRDLAHAAGYRSLLCVPITGHDTLLGTFMLYSRPPRQFAPEMLALLMTIGRQMAVAMERARLYEDIQRHAVELEQRVVERTAELQAALEKAQESDRLKSEFLDNVNHELRTPLSNIKLYLDLLAHHAEKDSKKRDRYVEILRRETQRLERLIKDLLRLSRLDLKKVQPQMVKTDVNHLLETLVTDRLALITSCGLTLATRWAADLPPAWVDPALLNQVATNLLTNAMHYTPAGGQITLTTSSHVAGGQTWITFSVADTGLGIDSDELPHLFERFYRGRAGKETGAPGTGLGLAVVQEILALHGGRVEVHSQPEQGSAFVVWLSPANGNPLQRESQNPS
ncbi:MAG: GAF domain-containing protein [Aquificales bacterium]|nr:GAF domain-containing protein [Aquificales bacterium]